MSVDDPLTLSRYLQISECFDTSLSDDLSTNDFQELIDHAAHTVPMPLDSYLPALGQTVLVWDEHHSAWFTAVYKKEMYQDEPKFWAYCIEGEDTDSYFETPLEKPTHWFPAAAPK